GSGCCVGTVSGAARSGWRRFAYAWLILLLAEFDLLMTIAFFSDVHGNLPALEAVLSDLEQRRSDMIFCLGDLVGYAPWPNEVVNEVRRRGIPTLAGNYDQGIGLASDNCGCAYKTDTEKELGAQSIAFTNQVIGAEERRYLRCLPKHLRVDFQDEPCTLSLLMVHGSPRKINEYLFEDRPEASFRRVLEDAGADILLFGHTHKPYHRTFAYRARGSDPLPARAQHRLGRQAQGR
ncbi:metallophosphoesterase family protein, partial [Hymenobacter sp. AT01-02]|uniref:metallophosphoesterase family protein n=1 Tax=Hymenobacter sp. AT01-02 TaxID=1571877 RepID=UPI000AD6E7D2